MAPTMAPTMGTTSGASRLFIGRLRTTTDSREVRGAAVLLGSLVAVAAAWTR